MSKEYSDYVRDSLRLRPIAYFPIYTQITGNFLSGILLAQLMYWFRKKSKIYKTEKELLGEVLITRSQFRTAISKVKKLPFLSISREKVTGKTHYTLHRKVFENYIINFIKDNPEVAETYADLLLDHDSFRAYYAQNMFGVAKNSQDLANIDQTLANIDQNVAKSSQNVANIDQNVVKSDQEEEKSRCVNSDQTLAKSDQDLANSDQDLAKSSTTHIQRVKSKDYKETTVISPKKSEAPKKEQENPSDSPSHLPSEGKPQSGKKIKTNYTPEFEFAWNLYTADSSVKGQKNKAAIAFDKAVKLFEDKQIIYSAIEKYKTSTSFELRPAQATSFLNGICKPGHKYYLDYIKGGFEERLENVKVRDAIRLKENISTQESYRKDLSKQGELNTDELLERTSAVNLNLYEKYGVEIGIFRFKKREDWIQYTGPDFVAIRIKHPMSKNDKVNVLFHIDELRQNLYVHLHGFVWSEELEQKYVRSNTGFSNIPSIEAPKKEDLIL